MRKSKTRALSAIQTLAIELETATDSIGLRRALGKLKATRKLVESAILSEAVSVHRGNLVHACRAIALPHRTAARWLTERPELQREVQASRRAAE